VSAWPDRRATPIPVPRGSKGIWRK